MSNTLEDSLDKALDHLIDWILGHDEEQLRNIDFRKAKNEVFYAIEPSILSEAHKIGLEAIGPKHEDGVYAYYDNDVYVAENNLIDEQLGRLSNITGVKQ